MREVKTGPDLIQIPLKPNEAIAARDGMSKLIYGLVFDWIIYRINQNLSPVVSSFKNEMFFGILDIAGFESFDVNGFEQLCINLSNEQLQKCFNFTVFETEMAAYREEGLGDFNLEFHDNHHIIDLIEGKQG